MAHGVEFDYSDNRYGSGRGVGFKEILLGIIAIVIIGFALILNFGGISIFGNKTIEVRNHYVEIPVTDYYENQIYYIVDDLCNNPEYDLSTIEKYKVLHDFVVKAVDYEYDALRAGIDKRLGSGANDPERALNEGIGVCGAYAQLYKDLCDEAGLDCEVVAGKAFLPGSTSQLGHAWNAICIGGNWYHVDCCWSDTGGGRYEYFARGDNYIQFKDAGSFREAEYSGIIFTDKDYKFDRDSMFDNITIDWVA